MASGVFGACGVLSRAGSGLGWWRDSHPSSREVGPPQAARPQGVETRGSVVLEEILSSKVSN